MLRLLAVLLASLVLLPATALAQTRLRFDVMGGTMVGYAQSPRVSSASFGPSLKVDLGIQLGDHAALFARVEGASILVASEGAAYLVGEWTPNRWVSLGTGIGYDGMTLFWVGGCDASVRPCIQNSWSGVSVPLVIGINIQPRRSGDAVPSRRRLRIEVEAASGYDERSATWGFHAFAGVGAAWM